MQPYTCVSVSILTFLGMVIVNKAPHYRVTKLEPHTTDTKVRSGQLQFCHPNSEAPIIARKAIPKLTEMDKLPVLNTSDDFPVDISDTEIIFRFAYILN